MKQVLFSCVGSTDPVRGEHDGGVLHIMRHYRPEKLYLIFSTEMQAFDEKEQRFDRVIQFIDEHWDGYKPELQRISMAVDDPSDLDTVFEPMCSAIERVAAENPDALILLNLSSGTPQMQMVMSQLMLDLRYRTKGIQIKNFEQKSGTSQRANSKDYELELELELNEDEEPGAPNRCIEPEMQYFRRQQMWQKISALLEERNYSAAEGLADYLPSQAKAMIHHLSARNRLDDAAARKHAKGIQAPFVLYPRKRVASTPNDDYRQVVEYYLMMKNLACSHRFSDFALRMNPFIVRLQQAMLAIELQKHYGIALRQIVYTDRSGRQTWISGSIRSLLPDLWTHITEELGGDLSDSNLSLFVLNKILAFFDDVPPAVTELFTLCQTLNYRRNEVAHQLTELTDDEIKQEIGISCEQLTGMMALAILKIYPECDPKIFEIYDTCTDFILSQQ